MSQIPPARADAFVRRPDPAVRAVLFYGPDAGKVRERAETLAGTVCPDLADPFRVADIAPRALAEDPGRLHDEAAALAFGGGRRVVRVRGAGDSVAEALSGFLAAPSGDALVVVEGGDLGKGSRLVQAFAGASSGAVIACYGDEGEGLDGLIDSVLAGHPIERDARALLRESLGADRLLSRRELEKLALYLEAGAPVDVGAVQAAVADAAGVTLEAIVGAAASGDSHGLDRALTRAWREGLSPVAVVRAALRHFQRLHRAAIAVAGGASAAGAVAALRPPPHFRAKGPMAQQVASWPAGRLEEALGLLLEAEIHCKTTGLPDRAIASRALLRLAAAAHRLGNARHR